MGRWQLSMMEKAIGSCIIALLIWMATTIQATATRLAVIESEMIDLRELTKDRYTRSDHDKYAAYTEKRLLRLEAKHGLE